MPSKYSSVAITDAMFTSNPDLVRKVYSEEIKFQASEVLRFAQFAKIHTELNKAPGNTIDILYYNNIPAGGKLNENEPIFTNNMSQYTESIQVWEYGNAVGFNEYLFRSSFSDLMRDASINLAQDYSEVLDKSIRDEVFANTINTVYGYEITATGRVTVNARGSLTTDYKLTTDSIKDAVETLHTVNAPKVRKGEFTGYVCMVHPHSAREIRDDPYWISANQYAGSELIFAGEIGRYEDVRFIETNMCPILTGLAGDGSDVYQSVVLGRDAYALAVGLPVELRFDDTVDFGRLKQLAWYSIWGTALLDPTNNPRSVVIESC